MDHRTLTKHFTGILQTDGYSGYHSLRAKPDVISVGCWDHARRKYVEVIQAADKEKQGKAAEILLLINKLYEFERDAKDMTTEDRRQHRKEYSIPQLHHIHETIKKIQAPPKSLLGIAITYTLNQWRYLNEYINHGDVPISNIWIENQIRPFAVGRRNWLFTGTPQSANKAALLYGLIQTCHINQISPRVYLEYVLTHAHDIRRGDMEPTALLPQFIDKSLLT